MIKDKTTIGVTPENQKVIEVIMDTGFFKEQIDVGKFAMSIAIRYRADINDIHGTDTKWNVGSFDNDGSLRTLIPALFPDCETPYKLLESLINTGLNIVSQSIEQSGHFDLMDWLEEKTEA